MLLYKSLLFLLLSSLGSSEYYYIYGEDFLDFIGDSEHFHVESYESISIYGVPSPTGGRHDEALYLTDTNYPSYIPVTNLPSSETVTLEFRFFCDESDSELVLVVDYNHKVENIRLCGSGSDIADPGMWVTESISRDCIAGDCTDIYLSLFGLTNDAGDVVGLYSIGVTTEESGTTQITSKSTSITTTLPSCPTDDMVVIAGEAYKIITDYGSSWFDINHLCSTYDLILAEPKTNAKEVAGYLLDNYPDKGFWFGARDPNDRNSFSWESSGLTIPGDSPLWYPGYGPGEDCDAADDEDPCCLAAWNETYPYEAVSCGMYARSGICQCP